MNTQHRLIALLSLSAAMWSSFSCDTDSSSSDTDTVCSGGDCLTADTESDIGSDTGADTDTESATGSDIDTVPSADLLYLDVRYDYEYEAGHCVDALNIPLNELEGRLDELGPLDTPIIIYCASGNRAGQALTILEAAGFTNAVNGGGFDALDCPKE